MDKYTPSEYLHNCFSYLKTKVFYRQCRFIRFPFYIRGGKKFEGGLDLTLGRFCRFELSTEKSTLFIGQRCEMGDNTHIVAMGNVEIGDDVLIASKCFISDTSHGCYKGEKPDNPLIPPNRRKLDIGKVIIGRNVWIGENAVILQGSIIGEGTIIGANSVVNSVIPSYSIAVGAPAKVVKKFIEGQGWVHV